MFVSIRAITKKAVQVRVLGFIIMLLLNNHIFRFIFHSVAFLFADNNKTVQSFDTDTFDSTPAFGN